MQFVTKKYTKHCAKNHHINFKTSLIKSLQIDKTNTFPLKFKIDKQACRVVE